ncbi:hypothetical protein DYBT9623_04043 [Dyadobacter sp. CECT 9623]|uniref:LysM domain-containing protein n=1 Tax=Dyadobacter linearis TaxID=2823330 RepID=A0ABM8UUN3_9BACT|nr:LysM domain-containing protein [Dyadobacter sp. CECT 9623]CAG5072122.1 hypothetical protein DYBT9623_04043 [Dyadobacter sp. CECT 9623]
MEDEFAKKRNIRPTEKSNLPVVTLLVLVLLVLAMLYVGYEYISDSSSNSEELTSVVVDSTLSETTVGEPVTDEPLDVVETEKAEPITKDPVAEKPAVSAKETKPTVSAASLGGQEITHSVQSGETFSSIASRYNLKTETLQGLNPGVSDVKSGVTKLKIQVQTVHTVGPGDVLRVVAGKYGVTKEALMKANGRSKDFSERGEKLIVPFASRK